MDGDFNAQALNAVLVLVLVAGTIRTVVRGRGLERRVEARPDGRLRFYRRVVLRQWAVVALVPLIAWMSTDLTAHDLGWAWPRGFLGPALAAYFAIMLTIGGLRMRRRLRRGLPLARRRSILFILPRTRRERWWALAVAITAGVTEETIYRGALIGVGVRIYHLPFLVAASAAVLLFVAAHAYQGGRGLLGAAFTGYVYTLVYALSGSLLLPILGHVLQDVIALLLIPAEPADRPRSLTPAEPTQPAQPADHPHSLAPAEPTEPTDRPDSQTPTEPTGHPHRHTPTEPTVRLRSAVGTEKPADGHEPTARRATNV